MAEEENRRAMLAEEEEDEESDTESDVEEFESEPDNAADDKPPPPEITPDSSFSGVLHQPNPNPNPNPNPDPQPSSGQNGPLSSGVPSGGGERRVLSLDDPRKLFQRLWTDEEEIIILRGFLDFTSKRGTTFASHQYDTGPFYEEIKRQLQLDFSKNQLIEKLRRLKKKYRNCASRIRSKGKNFSFRSPHEQAVFEIARHIWRPANKRDSVSGDLSGEDDACNDVVRPPVMSADANPEPSKRNPRLRNRNRRKFQQDKTHSTALPLASESITGLTVPVPPLVPLQVPVATETNPSVPVLVPDVPVSRSSSSGAVEETVRTCLSPLFRELIGSAIGTGPLGLPGLGPIPICPPGKNHDEKWRQHYILELEVYLRRIELVKEQVKSALEELQGAKS